MKNLFIYGTMFIAGTLFGAYSTLKSAEDGKVIYEDDDMFVRAADGKSCNWSVAQVHYKKPQH